MINRRQLEPKSAALQKESASHPDPRISPFLGLGLGILAVSTAAIFIRYAQSYAPSLTIAAYRLGLATLFLAPGALARRQELRGLRGRDLGRALLAGLFLAFHFASWITSLEYTSVASSVVLVTTTPLWVALLSPFLLKEPPNRATLAGMALALAGGAVVSLSDTCTWDAGRLACTSLAEMIQGGAFWGNLLAVMGAVMAALYLIIGRQLRGRLSLSAYIFVVYGSAAVFLVGFALAAGQPLLGYPRQALVWFLLLALIPQLFGHSIFNWALRYLPAAYVAITLLGEPVGSTILAYFLLAETPSALKIFGAILILIGIIVATLKVEGGKTER